MQQKLRKVPTPTCQGCKHREKLVTPLCNQSIDLVTTTLHRNNPLASNTARSAPNAINSTPKTTLIVLTIPENLATMSFGIKTGVACSINCTVLAPQPWNQILVDPRISCDDVSIPQNQWDFGLRVVPLCPPPEILTQPTIVAKRGSTWTMRSGRGVWRG